MATYTVQAPDGKVITLQGPDGASQADILAQAQRLYKPVPVSAVPASSPGPSIKNAFGLGAPPGPKGTPERAAYDAEYNKRFNAAWLQAHPAEYQRRRAQSDPAFAARLAAAEAQRKAANSAQRADLNAFDAAGSAQGGGFGTGFLGGFTRGTYGLGERLAAAGATYLPTWLGGVPGNATYDQNLAKIRANTDAQMARSTAGNILGQLTSGTAVTAGAGAGLGAGASRLAASGAPAAAKAGNILQELMTLKKAKGVALATRAANTGKVALAGAVGGAANAVGQGEDVTTGAATGAIAAPALGVAGKVVYKVLLQPVATALRIPGATAILRKYVGATVEDIQNATAAWKAKAGTNAEPTVYEVLNNLQDRESVRDALARMPASARDKAASLVRDRGSAMGPEMQTKIQEVVAPARAQAISDMQNDLAASKVAPGVPPPQLTPDEAALAENAANGVRGLKKLRKTINNNIMAPYDSTIVAKQPSELIPQTLGQPTDPEVASLISTTLGPRKLGQDITVNDVTRAVSKLKKVLPNAGVQTPIVQRTIAHLEDQLPADARAAYDRMTASNQKYLTTREGVLEGQQTRTGDMAPDTQAADNAYDTPAGATGRALGQTNILRAGLNQAPGASLRRAQEIASNPSMQEAINANLGNTAGTQIADAATAQAESARRLAGLGQEAEGQGSLDLADLARSVIGLHPGSMPMTKIKTLSTLTKLFQGIPEGRANQIVDALFSRNPAKVANTLKMLNNAGSYGQEALRRISMAVAGANAIHSGQDGRNSDAALATEPPSSDEETAEMVPDNEQTEAPSQPGDDPNVPYGHAVISKLFPEAQITSDVRGPNDRLSEENPSSYHTKSQNAVDVRPIPGMTFAQFIGKINDAGYKVVEAIDEVNHPSKFATGPHWHVVVM